ncbi:hypothetical protein HanPI659440_Chr02g0047511 [Helianthus annuus]|nr:hypothetical protein HanPI659440_Chr02g0047511 [Helianthus annuus]
MEEEFYNEFHNAFTSEITTSTPKNISKAISESLKHDSLYGTNQRPPKLTNIEDYNWWKDRFINWVSICS